MTEIRQHIIEEAAAAFERCSDDPDISQRIEGLLSKLDNGLPDEAILEQLRVIAADSQTK